MDAQDYINDLQNADLSDTRTGFAVLSQGLKTLRVEGIKTEVSKKGAPLLKIEAVTTQPDQDIDGKAVEPGHKIFTQISLKPTEKYDPKKALAEFMESVLGTKNGTFAPIDQYLGLEFVAQVKVTQSDEYGTQNQIARYVKKA